MFIQKFKSKINLLAENFKCSLGYEFSQGNIHHFNFCAHFKIIIFSTLYLILYSAMLLQIQKKNCNKQFL